MKMRGGLTKTSRVDKHTEGKVVGCVEREKKADYGNGALLGP
jgi:hypothetical protein